MRKPRNRPRRTGVEQEPRKDDEARLETFERVTERRDDETLAADVPDSLTPANEPLDAND